MATPRGKKMLRTNTVFKLIKRNPPGRFLTKKAPVRHAIPRGSRWPIAEYIAEFSGLNNLRPSEFTLNGKVVIA